MSIGSMGSFSKVQNTCFGGLIAVMGGRETIRLYILDGLKESGFVEYVDGQIRQLRRASVKKIDWRHSQD